MKTPSRDLGSCEGVVQFPRHVGRKGETGEIIAWLSALTRDLGASQYAALQEAYGGKLSIENRDNKPLLRYELFLRSAAHARQEARILAKRVHKHLGVQIILQSF